MVLAWYFNPSDEDKRLPHKKEPNVPVSIEDLERKTGVRCLKVDPEGYQGNETYRTLRKERLYKYEDSIDVTDRKPEFDEILKTFYIEHLHADDEVRYTVGGSGYFDVRDEDDAWIRIHIESGDLITLPAGIYHRFALDTKNHSIKLVRLFTEVPVWTPFPRPADNHPARLAYINSRKLKDTDA
ncbi:unnamed protein product [Owenia fusiformis]|uniref:Acireductone dioxygenase n=1 Tax=Owenia fusiformis TaxID=6347 RepID=A0A8S4N008_OWEFU|nr:unnamed protein product [Owenia fusiformis]